MDNSIDISGVAIESLQTLDNSGNNFDILTATGSNQIIEQTASIATHSFTNRFSI